MILAIDSSNIITGGGVTHLIELCNNYKPENHLFKKIIIFGNSDTNKKIYNKKFIKKINIGIFSKNIFLRYFWILFLLPILFKKHNCNLLFAPGGIVLSKKIPSVTMCRNLQPFEINKNTTYGYSLRTLRLYLLRYLFNFSFKKSLGVIFLTNYANSVVNKRYGSYEYKSVIIPHGVNSRFNNTNNSKLVGNDGNLEKLSPIKVIYVSTIDVYKHQWNVVEAISFLRKTGLSIELILIGSSNSYAYRKLEASINKFDKNREFVKILGFVNYNQIHEYYHRAHIGIFASSCENMPNILIEMMRSNLPIACSNLGPMPEILKDGGIYFNPLSSKSIATAIKNILDDSHLRKKTISNAFLESKKYSWSECAKNTFKYLDSAMTGLKGN